MAVTRASQEAIRLRQLLEQLGYPQKSIPLYGDNQGASALANSLGDHPRSKHLQLHYHFIHYAIENGSVQL